MDNTAGARRSAGRSGDISPLRDGARRGERYAGLTKPSKTGAVWTGVVRAAPEAFDLPLRWRRPRKIFVNSMSDLFHEGLHWKVVAEIFGVMAVAGNVGGFHGPGDGKTPCGHYTTSGGKRVQCYYPNYGHGPHTFQILTKRDDRMGGLILSSAFRKEVSRTEFPT